MAGAGNEGKLGEGCFHLVHFQQADHHTEFEAGMKHELGAAALNYNDFPELEAGSPVFDVFEWVL